MMAVSDIYRRLIDCTLIKTEVKGTSPALLCSAQSDAQCCSGSGMTLTSHLNKLPRYVHQNLPLGGKGLRRLFVLA